MNEPFWVRSNAAGEASFTVPEGLSAGSCVVTVQNAEGTLQGFAAWSAAAVEPPIVVDPVDPVDPANPVVPGVPGTGAGDLAASGASPAAFLGGGALAPLLGLVAMVGARRRSNKA
ncbi:hypothetical protein ACFUCV_06590 [Specibacter sp. NPDC057265]|uniref:hypothetical protein n=1 Tax=Specibacter sp. NPDC057265 TaxID=3346075 RepID=UPI0036385856